MYIQIYIHIYVYLYLYKHAHIQYIYTLYTDITQARIYCICLHIFAYRAWSWSSGVSNVKLTVHQHQVKVALPRITSQSQSGHAVSLQACVNFTTNSALVKLVLRVGIYLWRQPRQQPCVKYSPWWSSQHDWYPIPVEMTVWMWSLQRLSMGHRDFSASSSRHIIRAAWVARRCDVSVY